MIDKNLLKDIRSVLFYIANNNQLKNSIVIVIQGNLNI